MAVTKIHPIKLTLRRAVQYVINPKKTDEYALVDAVGCDAQNADKWFEQTLAQASNRKERKNANKAYHLIQSFVPTETTPEEAHQIGMELCDKLLGGKYSFVIGTHVDKHHIHNHIIFCAVDNIDLKKYNDCKESYRQIRQISDTLCEEHGLDVITPEKQRSGHYRGGAKSYKEWLEDGKGKSWKSQLKTDIRETIRESKTYEEFIEKMRTKGYKIKGEKLDNSNGKYISYLCPGQDEETGRWIRGKKTSGNRGLGEDFSKEAIASKIEERQRKRAERIAQLTGNKSNLPKEQSTKLISTDTDKYRENSRYAKKIDSLNFKAMTEVYARLQKLGFRSIDELAGKVDSLRERIADNQSEITELDDKLKGYAEIINIVETYKQNKKYYDAYKRSTDPERYLENRISEITMFQEAEKLCKKHGIEPDKLDVKTLRDKYSEMETRKAQLQGAVRRDQSEEKTLGKYLDDFTKWSIGEKNIPEQTDKNKKQSL